MATRYIHVRANNAVDAKRFANLSHKKYSTMSHSPERVSSVVLDKSQGLAGGVPSFKVGLTRMKISRYKKGTKKDMLIPKHNKAYGGR